MNGGSCFLTDDREICFCSEFFLQLRGGNVQRQRFTCCWKKSWSFSFFSLSNNPRNRMWKRSFSHSKMWTLTQLLTLSTSRACLWYFLWIILQVLLLTSTFDRVDFSNTTTSFGIELSFTSANTCAINKWQKKLTNRLKFRNIRLYISRL